jgi:hypothetical protein
MKCKLYFILSQDGSISNEGTTPHDEVAEFVKTAPLTINDWTQVRKDMRKIMSQYLRQFPRIKKTPPTGGETVTIPKSEYDGMKNTIAEQSKIIAAQAIRIEEQDKIIAAQAVRIEALEKENSQLRQQVVELQKENSDLKRVVETLIHRIEFLEAKH